MKRTDDYIERTGRDAFAELEAAAGRLANVETDFVKRDKVRRIMQSVAARLRLRARAAVAAAIDRAYVDGVRDTDESMEESGTVWVAFMETENFRWMAAGADAGAAKAGLLRAWRSAPDTDKTLSLTRLEELYGVRAIELRAGESYKDGERI